MFVDEFGAAMRDVQVQAVRAQAFHLVVDRARDDIARCQFGARIEAVHETRAVGEQQLAALATHGFRDQGGLGARVVQAGRMELHEFHVSDPAAGAPGHGDAVAGRAIRVAGVQVHFAGAAGREHHRAGADRLDPPVAGLEHVGPHTAALTINAACGDEVDGVAVWQQFDIRVRLRAFDQHRLDRAPGGIGGMDDAPMRMAAFAREVVGRIAAGGLAREGDTERFQPVDALRAMLDGESDDVGVTETRPRIERIVDMGVEAVAAVQYSGDAALGVPGIAFRQRTLRQYGYARMLGGMQGECESRGTAAKDEYVGLEGVGHRLSVR